MKISVLKESVLRNSKRFIRNTTFVNNSELLYYRHKGRAVMEIAEKKDNKITLNGKPITLEKLEEQKKLAEKTGAKVTETSPGKFNIRLND
jgi:hypothetical protein